MKITLANLHEATAQQVFDQVATHLLTQKVRSMDPVTGSCAYRGENSTMCAGGCLIADAEYTPEMEGTDWTYLARPQSTENISYRETHNIADISYTMVPTTHVNLIVRLQKIHDVGASSAGVQVGYWKHQLMNCASQFGLIIPDIVKNA